jgi:hypothetical protein
LFSHGASQCFGREGINSNLACLSRQTPGTHLLHAKAWVDPGFKAARLCHHSPRFPIFIAPTVTAYE